MSANDVPVVDGWVASEPLCPATDPQAFCEAVKAGAAAASTASTANDEAARDDRRLAFIDMVKGNSDERPAWATDEDVEMAAQLRSVISADADSAE